jgi:signal transduction histidine kinase
VGPRAMAANGIDHSLIVSRAYWKDESGLATLEQARQQSFTSYQGDFSAGYTQGAHWLRIELAASPSPIGLRITPPWVDNITLYDALQPGTRLTAGDSHPGGSTAVPVLGYVLTLPAAEQPRELMIRLSSTSAHRLALAAVPQADLAELNTRAIVWTSVYTAMMFIIFLVLASIWLMQPELLVGAYLIRHTVYSAYGILFLGLPQMLLSDTLPDLVFDLSFSLSVVLLLPVAFFFEVVLLRSYRPQRHLFKAVQLLAMASPLPLLLLLLGFSRQALEVTVQSMLPIALLIVVTAGSTRPDPSVERLLSKRVMMAYYLLVLGSLSIGLPSVLGWAPAPPWMQYLLILHGLVSGIAMTTILLLRGQRLHRTRQQVTWQLQLAQQEADRERQRRQEQSQFLHLLMHELKTPLAVVSLALGTREKREENLAHAGRAVQDMKAILERCLQVDPFDELAREKTRTAVDPVTAVAEVADPMAPLAQRLRLMASPDLPTLHTDEQLLKIVLTNLLDNAVRYGQPHSPVEVQLEPASDGLRSGVQISVRNSPGPAGKPDADKVFSKYYRASGAQQISGSGLGLHLSQQLARTLGGSLRYLCGAEQVEFVLWLPAAP